MAFKVLCPPVMIYDYHVGGLLIFESRELKDLVARKYRADFVVFNTKFYFGPTNVSVPSVEEAW